MALPQSSMNRRTRPESADPFAMQLALSRVHARLVPMQRNEQGYAVDPCAADWSELPTGRGFAGYGLSRALRMLLDILRGLTALHDTFDAEGFNFAHGEVALTQFRVDSEGVCRLVPLTAHHSGGESKPPIDALGYLAPERLLGEPIDARADVFSAGVLLWEALSGRRLFGETDGDAIVERLMGEKLPMPQLPPELAWAIPLKSIAARALSVDPYQRFADCAELATAIAIVARERVATHAEIAACFGTKGRSLNSVAQKRPVPTRSSTFPSVSSLATPPSISAPPSSRNGFPLATPASRSVTPAPRSVTPAPRSVTPAPRSVTPAPRSVTPALHSVPPAAPLSASRGPESQRPVMHKSPFATLLGTGDIVPASHRRKTLMSVGTPPSALAPVEAAPVSAPPSSTLPPPLPLWAGVSTAPLPPSQAPRSSSAIVARATLESIPLSEVAKFRGWSSRRSLIVLSLVALLVAGLALVAMQSSGDGSMTNRGPDHTEIAAAAAATAVREAATTPDNLAPSTPTPSVVDPSSGSPANNARDLRPSKAAAPSRPASGSGTRDYGI